MLFPSGSQHLPQPQLVFVGEPGRFTLDVDQLDAAGVAASIERQRFGKEVVRGDDFALGRSRVNQGGCRIVDRRAGVLALPTGVTTGGRHAGRFRSGLPELAPQPFPS
jgi:hypothetical protein